MLKGIWSKRQQNGFMNACAEDFWYGDARKADRHGAGRSFFGKTAEHVFLVNLFLCLRSNVEDENGGS